MYQSPPVLSEQQQGDTRMVTIPRRIAETALIDEYKDMLREMSDEDIARLFEEEILMKRPHVAPTQQVLKEFPTENVLGKSLEKEERIVSPSSVPLPMEDADETALLLQGGDDKKDDSMVPQIHDAILNRIFEGGLLGMQGRSKDLAAPIMGTGALVVGVALMYTLISTLSGGRGEERSTPEEAPPPQLEKQFDPSTDPYTMYNTAAGAGEIIWQRQEEDGNTVKQKVLIDEDPWRTPMSDANTQQLDTPVKSNGSIPIGKRTQIENKRPPPLDQILDNAESISKLKRVHSPLPTGDASRSKASS